MTARVTRFAGRAAQGPAERIAGFLAHLRMNGMRLGVAETGAALAALTRIDPTDVNETRLALRAVCTGTAEEAARFDDLFAAYWLNRGGARVRAPADRGQDLLGGGGHTPYVTQAVMAGGKGRPDRPGTDDATAAQQEGEGRLVASGVANRMHTDLREFVTPEEVAEAEVVAERLARAIRDRRSRRRKAARRGPRLDLRRVARRSVATGGEPLHLYWRKRPERPANLVALLDVSGSMKVYARVFLAFLKGLIEADLRADAYLFHTRLVRMTDALRDADHMRAVNRLSLLAQGFGGGTRIAGALAAFNRGYAAQRVNGRSVVIILSDGYDTDPPDMLGRELAILRRRGCRILWLNPLKGWSGYSPVAAGMAAALPQLDLFAAATTLNDLAALEGELARL